MKAIVYTLAFLFSFACTTHQAQAQSKAWERNSKVLALGIGLSHYYHLDNYYYRDSPRGRGYYSPTTAQFNLQMEFGIHQYVGLGFTTGLGLRNGWKNGYNGEINLPIGLLVNFHFYQLIADKSSKDIAANEVDLYVGITAGGGFAMTYYNDTGNRLVPIAFGGPHLGIRWYFTKSTALNAEFGWGGKSAVNIGFAFKL